MSIPAKDGGGCPCFLRFKLPYFTVTKLEKVSGRSLL